MRIEDDLPGVGAQDVSVSIPGWKDLENSGIFQPAYHDLDVILDKRGVGPDRL